MPSLPTQYFGQQICQIRLHVLFPHSNGSSRCCFMNHMIIHSIVLLAKSWLWYTRIVDHTSVEAHHIYWFIQCYTKHSQLLSHQNDQILCYLHSQELRSKWTAFHCILLLREPDNWCIHQVNQNPWVWSPGNNVTRLVCTNKTSCVYTFT